MEDDEEQMQSNISMALSFNWTGHRIFTPET